MHRPDLGRINSDEIPRLALAASMRSAAGANLSPQGVRAEGRKLCVELIQELREIKGVNGVHVMAYRQEEAVAEVIESSGVLAGRVPWYPGRHNIPQREKAAS